MTTKSKALSKGYGYVDESNVIHKIDPKFLSNSIKLEIPADKVASILEQLEDDGQMGAETLTSVILDGETKTIDASVCETIKTFAKANAIVFNFKDADGNGAAFAQCAYDIKSTGAEATAYFACDEMPYKLMFALDEAANTLVVAAIAKGTTEGGITIGLTEEDMVYFADMYFCGGKPIAKLMIDGVETALTDDVFDDLLIKAKNGLLNILGIVEGEIVRPLGVIDGDNSQIMFDFPIPVQLERRGLTHCRIFDMYGTYILAMDFDVGEAISFQLIPDDVEYFQANDYIGRKEITTISEWFLNGEDTEITEGICNVINSAISRNALAVAIDGDTGYGTVTQTQYVMEDGTYIDATIQFQSIDRAMDLVIDWNNCDKFTINMRKLSQSAESSDYVFYAAKGTGGVAKYYKSYNDAISGGTEVTPDWAAIRTDILKNNANAKIKLLITEQDSGGNSWTVVRTYECVGVRTADGKLEFRCIEFEGDDGMV